MYTFSLVFLNNIATIIVTFKYDQSGENFNHRLTNTRVLVLCLAL